MRTSDRARGLAMLVGGLRLGVGALLIGAPSLASGRDGSSRMLVRTIGIRDVVLGLGTLAAALTGDVPRRLAWMRAGLLSDAGDVALSAASVRQLGVGAAVAAVIPLPVIAAGVAHELESRDCH